VHPHALILMERKAASGGDEPLPLLVNLQGSCAAQLSQEQDSASRGAGKSPPAPCHLNQNSSTCLARVLTRRRGLFTCANLPVNSSALMSPFFHISRITSFRCFGSQSSSRSSSVKSCQRFAPVESLFVTQT